METHTYSEAVTAARAAYQSALITCQEELSRDPDRCIEELRREIEQRAGVYPSLIAKGRLHADHAAKQTVRLLHAIEILEEYRQPGML